ncbi:hypothetical protein BDZ89DRAFT_1166357 [Hymenopellis radicata]|nr:hypothetical protein BDZ89DRAFT_1166357 [Hymenopellis radicata]
MPVPQIPPELLQGILQTIWDDKLLAWERIHFMKSCPLVNREWRAMYDVLASRDVYIPSMQYLHYLLRIIAKRRSHIHVPSQFASRTRHVIVQTVELDDDQYDTFQTVDQTEDHGSAIVTHSKIISQLAQCSFTGVHLCFPAATHIIFEAINTLDASPYMALRVQLDDRSTVTAEWRVDLGSPILPQENWDEKYRRHTARAVAGALNDHMCIDADGCPPDVDTVCRLLRLEGGRILALEVSWEPEPFSGDYPEDLDLYFRRAVDGYYSFFIFARWLDNEMAHLKRRRPLPEFFDRTKNFHIKQDIQPFWGRRLHDVVLAALVDAFIVYRWPLVSVAYTGLIVCFCSRHSFLVSVSIVTIIICIATTSLVLLTGLVFYVFRTLVGLFALKRLVQFLRQWLEI